LYVAQNRKRAAVIATLAIGFASMQDAVVKGVSADIPAYETIIFRTVASFPLLFGWLLWSSSLRAMLPERIGLLMLRSLILCSAYFAFVLSIAALPIATSVSIYFTMPFFVAALAGWALGENVRGYRWVAISAGFIGVLVMVRPGVAAFEPAALLALYSAFGYAVGQMMGRYLSQRIEPVIIANWQNLTYFSVAVLVGLAAPFFAGFSADDKVLSFLLRPWAWPNQQQFLLLLMMGCLSTFAAVAFIHAYRMADANFVAPFEYTALLWAVMNGLIFFGDFPDQLTWIGAAIVVGAGLWMVWMDYHTSQST
jgi:drug/metabolite transporter (DMT)-like permease